LSVDELIENILDVLVGDREVCTIEVGDLLCPLLDVSRMGLFIFILGFVFYALDAWMECMLLIV
jgi:hypothetical protein